jgi:glycosyltransferase involved in cell wall biosynthesis
VLPAAEGTRIGMIVPEIRHVIHAYEAVRHCDVVHDHTMAGPFYSERFPGLPVTTTIHGPFNEELTDIYRANADRVPIIAISHAQRRAAPNIPIARVIHHGIDASLFPVGDGAGDEDGPFVLFLGRMADDKGAHRAIEVARKAGIRIMLAAKMREQWEMHYFSEQVEPLLGSDARYLGEVSHERKLDLLARASALLFPIRWNEPFGMVMIEAMACGTPVLAFPEGAAPEVVDDGRTGFLCDDEAAMVEAIGRLDQLDRNDCRLAVEGYFSTQRMVSQHIELFESLVS